MSVVVVSAEYAIINCSWPCPDTSHGCIVTSQEAYCGERLENSWIIHSPQKAPYYTGASVSVNLQPCQLAPFPPLLPAAAAAAAGKQLIEWPMDNPKRPYDIYLGNCGHGFYCSSISLNLDKPVCRHRYKINERCESSNQCMTSFCSHNGTCQALINSQQLVKQQQEDEGNDNKRKMVEILASVFGIVGGFAVIGISLFLYRKYKLNYDNNDKIEEENIIQHNSSILPLQQQFASDFEHDEISSQFINQTQPFDIPPPSYKP